MTKKNDNQWRACARAEIDPRVYRRRSTTPTDAALRTMLKELSGERRLLLLIGHDGWKVNGIEAREATDPGIVCRA